MLRFSFLILIVISSATGASAQDSAKVEVLGGYSFSRQIGEERFGHPSRNGYEVSVTGYPLGWLGVEAALTDHFGAEDVPYGVLFPAGSVQIASFDIRTRLTSLMVGPKVAFRGKRVSPYAHFLVGGVRQKTTLDVEGFSSTEQSDSAFGFAVGGGVNLKLNDRFTLRMGQLDYVRSEIDFREGQTGVVLVPFTPTIRYVCASTVR